MFKIDDETAEEVINRLDQAHASNIVSDKLFHDEVIGHMGSTFAARPWILCLALYIYRCLYLILRYVASRYGGLNTAGRSNMNERLEEFRFASEFGRLADAAGRDWFFEQIKLSKINKIDAAFLAWSNVIQIRRRNIYLCRWDSISGYFLMLPLLLLVIVAGMVCICDGISAGTKSFQVTVYLAQVSVLFKFYKSMSFDVYRVASKYYITNSWFGEPILRQDF